MEEKACTKSSDPPLIALPCAPVWDPVAKVFSFRSHLEVKTSSIPNAGKGLFARRLLPVGTAFPYLGIRLNLKPSEFHLISHGERERYLVARHDEWVTSCPISDAPFVPFRFECSSSNEGRTAEEINAQFDYGWLVLVQEVKKGQEILTHYGEGYRRGYKAAVAPLTVSICTPSIESFKQLYGIKEPVLTSISQVLNFYHHGRLPRQS